MQRYFFLLQHYLRESALKYPHKIAVFDETTHLSYELLERQTDKVARSLRAKGIGTGHRVMIIMGREANTAIAIYGVLKAGATYVPLQPGLPADFFKACVDQACPSLVISNGLSLQLDNSQPTLPVISLENLLDQDDQSSQLPITQEPCDNDLAYIHFSSGSTGRPKGVGISHRAAIEYYSICANSFQNGASQIILGLAPLTFDLSSFDLHLAIRWGATLGHPSSGEKFFEFIEKYSVSLFYTAPTFLNRLAGKISTQRPIESMKYLIFAGEAPNVPVLKKFRKIFPNAYFHHWYGSTEAAIVSTFCIPPSMEIPDPVPIGQIVPNLDACILRNGKTSSLSAQTEGELLVSSTLLFTEYVGNKDATKKVWKEMKHPLFPNIYKKWFRTGDLVRCDEKLNLFHVCRLGRVVKVRSIQVNLDYIESVVSRLPAVKACAVVGIPHHLLGTCIEIFIELHDIDNREIENPIKQFLPFWMHPQRFWYLKSLPETQSGKIDRKTLELLASQKPIANSTTD